jgi:hypothetical protein
MTTQTREQYLRDQIKTVTSRLRRSLRIIEIRALQDLLSRLECELTEAQKHNLEEINHE